MKKLGFLSFGHWAPSPQSETQSAADALLQSIDLAVEAERLRDADPIIRSYPELFDVAGAPGNSSMQFGIQVESPAGREIVARLCVRLRPLAAAARDEGIEFAILEVKEKFGSLRINYRGGTDEIAVEIDKAKHEAITPMTRGQQDELAWQILYRTPPIPIERARGGRPMDYQELDAQLRDGVAFEHAWSNFLHAFFAHRTASFFVYPSPPSLSPRWQALLAGAAEWLSVEFNLLPVPQWTSESKYFLPEPWDPWSDLGLDVTDTIERTLAKSPEAFRKRNVAYESRNLISL
jgi:hypothetical protein